MTRIAFILLALASIAIFAAIAATAIGAKSRDCIYSHCSENGTPDPNDPKVQTDLKTFHRRLRDAQEHCQKDMSPYVNLQECVMVTYEELWSADNTSSDRPH